MLVHEKGMSCTIAACKSCNLRSIMCCRSSGPGAPTVSQQLSACTSQLGCLITGMGKAIQSINHLRVKVMHQQSQECVITGASFHGHDEQQQQQSQSQKDWELHLRCCSQENQTAWMQQLHQLQRQQQQPQT